MNVELFAAAELPPKYRERWRELHGSNPDLRSPYFHPEFTAAVARAHDDVEIAVVERSGEPVAFFPFQRGRFGVGRPVGGRLSDYHGVIMVPYAKLDARRLMRACKLTVWPFDHALASQELFRPFAEIKSESPTMDLRGGFEAYLEGKKKSGASRISQMQRKGRKLAREVGPVRLEVQVDDPAALDQVIRWKSEQCRRTGVYDFFSDERAVRLVRDIAQTKVDGFEGLVSVLYVGDAIAAAHMGMRTEDVLHWWFPGYEHSLSQYSPGGILLLELAKAMADLGISTLDLGKGDDAYKPSFMTGAVPLIEGAVDVPSAAAFIRRSGIRGRRWIRRSPMMEPLRRAVRRVRGTS